MSNLATSLASELSVSRGSAGTLATSGGNGKRVFVREFSKLSKTGKVLIIPAEWTFDQLRDRLSEKFGMQIGDVYLDTQQGVREEYQAALILLHLLKFL